MARTEFWFLTTALLVGGLMLGTAAAEPALSSGTDIRALYGRLQPGMSVAEVAGSVGRARLTEGDDPVTSWLVWAQTPDRRGVVVLRAAFRDGVLTRLEYESFGDAYRRLVKGDDPAVEIAATELARIWRKTWKIEEAAVICRDALDAFHRLLQKAQERLTPDEQQAWARALELRRSVEDGLARVGRQP